MSVAQRQVYMVLSPHALPYARTALEGLVTNSVEPINLRLITDSEDDKKQLEDAMTLLAPSSEHRWSVTAEEELNDAEATIFAGLPHLRAFRHGHPCWRKITDPVLLGAAGEELILLDPDLYFPNKFRFEPTPTTGLLLMWQQPNCLLPHAVVEAAFDAKIALARHVDIGVSHWRLSEARDELAWIDWLIGKLGGSALPRMMHVEAIVWSAIAMRGGGGYLDAGLWRCWHRTQWKRLQRKVGVAGPKLLSSEPWSEIKCFHAGGEAKWWLPSVSDTRVSAQLEDGRVLPFVELTLKRYENEQRAKAALRSLGYYKLFGAKQG